MISFTIPPRSHFDDGYIEYVYNGTLVLILHILEILKVELLTHQHRMRNVQRRYRAIKVIVILLLLTRMVLYPVCRFSETELASS